MWNMVPCSFGTPYLLTHTYKYINMHLGGLLGGSVMGEKGWGTWRKGVKENVCKGKKAEEFQKTVYSPSPDATDIIPRIFPKY